MSELTEFEIRGGVGIARLIREKSLNSLTLETIDELSARIYPWLADEEISCLILDSSSDRAFCAGADITDLYHAIRAGDLARPEAFFLHEYRLDYALQTADKPVVAWGNGIVMGGGLGLLGGCSHRIGTPLTRIAMPEITIGLFPDAGGTAFLSTLGDLGLFAGLTGCQLSAGDAKTLGLLDFVVAPECREALVSEIVESDGSHAAINELISRHQVDADLPLQLLRHEEVVRDLMRHCRESSRESSDTTGFLASFEAGLADLPDDEWLQQVITTYQSGSATTAHVFVEQMRRAEDMTLAEMFRQELVIAYQCIRHGDFPEGVRALLVDKDRNPAWTYAATADVPQAHMLAHFEPSWEGAHPLADLS